MIIEIWLRGTTDVTRMDILYIAAIDEYLVLAAGADEWEYQGCYDTLNDAHFWHLDNPTIHFPKPEDSS